MKSTENPRGFLACVSVYVCHLHHQHIGWALTECQAQFCLSLEIKTNKLLALTDLYANSKEWRQEQGTEKLASWT